ATDIYQFGMLCFLILSERLPYRADTNDSLAWARAVTEEEPMTLARAFDAAEHAGVLSKASARTRYRRGLSRDLDAVVRKALQKAPAHRYRSWDAMAADLDAAITNRPVIARPAGPLYFLVRFVRRQRVLVTTVTLALAALAAIGIFALRESRTAAE